MQAFFPMKPVRLVSPNFTGAFLGMACQDLSGSARAADFAWFEYCDHQL